MNWNQCKYMEWCRVGFTLLLTACGTSGSELNAQESAIGGDFVLQSSLFVPGQDEDPQHIIERLRVIDPVSLGERPADRSNHAAWWKPLVARRQRSTPQSLRVSLNSVLMGALAHSAQIQVISDTPLISETAIAAADAAFDWTTFLEARWDDISEPVGNTLTTGGPNRFHDHVFSYEMGVRRRNVWGGEFEIGQQFGHQNNNSIFFVPNDQGTARLTLNYTQPLLRGAGRVYNTSLTVLAQFDTGIAQDEFSRQLQNHLVDVTRSYWTLYLERGKLLQQRRLLESGVEILAELESRSEIDALQSQIVRARSAVASRRADLVRANFDIRTAEARIRALVNDPALGDTLSTELLPQEQLGEDPFPVDLPASVAEALRKRPEINQAIMQVKAACVRMHMSKRESLPLMNVVFETHVAGLEGNSSVGGAFTEQFSEGEPSYGLGLQYEYPIWNRAATSKVQRRRLEVRRLQHQFRATVETLKLEVEISVHAVTSAYDALKAKYRAIEAAALEVDYLRERWHLLPVENGSASFLLEDLLDAQERLAGTEREGLETALAFNLAQVAYKQSIGSLLETNHIRVDRRCECDLPRHHMFQVHPHDTSIPSMTSDRAFESQIAPVPPIMDLPPAPASRDMPPSSPVAHSEGFLTLTELPDETRWR